MRVSADERGQSPLPAGPGLDRVLDGHQPLDLAGRRGGAEVELRQRAVGRAGADGGEDALARPAPALQLAFEQ